jgi:hypothetical protein
MKMLNKLKTLAAKIDRGPMLAALSGSLLLLLMFIALFGLGDGLWGWFISFGLAMVAIAFLVESGIV